jgi:hypothetical protein
MEKEQKKAQEAWNLGRFVKTLAYFGVIPFLSDNSWFQTIMGNPVNSKLDGKALASSKTLGNQSGINTEIKTLAQNLILFNFLENTQDLQNIWGAVDDVVMGGVSQSNITIANSGAIFSGIVSTANSGGFASVRTRSFEPPLNLSKYTGIELRVKGDGQRYKLILRGESKWDGVGFSASFDTELERWTTVRIPFTQLIAGFRSKSIPNTALDSSQVYAFQLMLSKYEYDGALNSRFTAGNFQLQIESISAYSN